MVEQAQRKRRYSLLAAICGLAAAAIGVIGGIADHDHARIAIWAVLGAVWVVLLAFASVGRWPRSDHTP